MKNKVLRLAIVAVLVVAMVLSMAACNNPKPVDPTPVVTPTPTKTPDKTVAPSTPAPTKTPDVSSDEATLEAKYGITFPVVEGMKVDFKPSKPAVDTTPAVDYSDLWVPSADGKQIKFEAKKPTYNDAFNAYNTGVGDNKITVTAKVSGLTAEGGKIELDEIVNPDSWATYAPTKAGTYTVVYTVKVVYDGDTTYGAYKPAKVSETYSVTKVYEVGKKAITIESVSDAHKKSDKLAYPVATLLVGGKEQSNVQAIKILEELKLAGTDAKYGLSIDIVSADLTAYGTYPLTLVCLDGKNQKVDLSTLVAPDFEVTFKNGNRYVLTNAELAAAVAAQDDVEAAVKTGAKKEDIELGVATYTALSDASKTWFLQGNVKIEDKTLANAGKALDMNKNYKNLSRNGMVEEALKLAKVWNDKLQNAEDGKAFVTYMLSLSKKPVVIDGVPYATDYDFVVGNLNAIVTADKTGGKAYITKALGLVDIYEKTVLTNFANKYNLAVAAADFSNADNTGKANLFDKAAIEKFAKKVAAAQTAYDALVAGQEKYTITAANVIIADGEHIATGSIVKVDESVKKNFARLVKASSEATARYTAYATLVDGLDAYTGDKATKVSMTALLGYDFAEKMIKFISAESTEAAYVVFATPSVSDYVVFATPMLFVENAVKSYKTLVDAFVALDAAIVSAQKDVITNLGSKIKFAADNKVLVDSFNGTNFENTTADLTDITRLEALQKFIADKAIDAVKATTTEPVFAALAKKELSVVIAAALKEPVAMVNDYIKEENAFMFSVKEAPKNGATAIEFNNLFAGAKLEPKHIAITVYTTVANATAKKDPVAAIATTVTINSITGLKTIAEVPTAITLATGNVVEITYNGITVSTTVIA